MKLLLDTNAVIWAVGVSGRLSAEVRAILDDADNELWVSTCSIHEIAIKVAIGKLKPPKGFPGSLETLGCRALTVTVEDAWRVASLPLIHRDPFDRLIVAQALARELTLVTSDGLLGQYGVELLVI